MNDVGPHRLAMHRNMVWSFSLENLLEPTGLNLNLSYESPDTDSHLTRSQSYNSLLEVAIFANNFVPALQYLLSNSAIAVSVSLLNFAERSHRSIMLHMMYSKLSRTPGLWTPVLDQLMLEKSNASRHILQTWNGLVGIPNQFRLSSLCRAVRKNNTFLCRALLELQTSPDEAFDLDPSSFENAGPVVSRLLILAGSQRARLPHRKEIAREYLDFNVTLPQLQQEIWSWIACQNCSVDVGMSSETMRYASGMQCKPPLLNLPHTIAHSS